MYDKSLFRVVQQLFIRAICVKLSPGLAVSLSTQLWNEGSMASFPVSLRIHQFDDDDLCHCCYIITQR